jgi:dihydrofolate reductase
MGAMPLSRRMFTGNQRVSKKVMAAPAARSPPIRAHGRVQRHRVDDADGSRENHPMRKLTFGMNLSLDGYIAAPGDDLGWSLPSDELFQWWSDRVAGTSLALYGRRLWQTMSSHWPTADQQPGVTPAQIEYARRWRDMPKVVFSQEANITVDWNARLVTGDAAGEITRLKTEDGGVMDIAGATLAAAAMRAGLIDEYTLVTHPVLIGGGTPFFPALDTWVNLNLVETRTFPDGVLLTRYETRR